MQIRALCRVPSGNAEVPKLRYSHDLAMPHGYSCWTREVPRLAHLVTAIFHSRNRPGFVIRQLPSTFTPAARLAGCARIKIRSEAHQLLR